MDPRDTQSDLCTGVSDPQNTSELCQVFTRCIQSQCPLSSSAAVSNLCDQNVRTNFERVLLCQEGASINTCDELFSAYDMGCPPDSNTTPTTGSVFQCANGQQIPAHQKCDYFRDCADESDESENLNCQEPFLCKQTNQPIDPVQLCDGTPDCNDGSDEDQARCPSLFDCMDGTYLIYEAVCDLFVDCTSGYDELVCGLK